LHIAAERGDVLLITLFTEHGFAGFDNEGNTPLMLAAAQGHEDAVETLASLFGEANDQRRPSALKLSCAHPSQKIYDALADYEGECKDLTG